MTAKPLKAALFATTAILSPAVLADGDREALGYNDLIRRLGEDAPDGAGIPFGQAEAPVNGNYVPDINHPNFSGKTFTFHSGGSQPNNHATTVGRHAYGNAFSIAPGVTDVHNWEVNHWIGNGLLRTNSGQLPLSAPVDLFNHSWIGFAGNFSNEILRRADWVIDQQDVLMVVGVGNGNQGLDPNDILMSHFYNGVTVGRSDGAHHHGGTLSGIDGAGRQKPDIVAPDRATSWTTGLVSGVVATLYETARTSGGLFGNPNADDSEIIKAVLLAGTTRRPGWSNDPIEVGSNRGVANFPYDPTFGADQANINTSHLILTGGEHDGSTSVPRSGSAPEAAWDLAPINAGQNLYYRFEISQKKAFVSMLATWHRRVDANFNSSSVPNIDIELFRVNAQGNLISLRGPGGASFFETGSNIASISVVDNVELIHARQLQPANYVLRLSRGNDGLGSWDVGVAWFVPSEAVAPAQIVDLVMLDGFIVSGGIPEIQVSDDAFLETEARVTGEVHQPHLLRILLGADSEVQAAETFELTFESRITDTDGTVWLFLRDWNTGDMVEVDMFSIGLEEITRETTVPDAGRFLRASDGRIEMEIRKIVFFPFTLNGFHSLIDHVEIGVR